MRDSHGCRRRSDREGRSGDCCELAGGWIVGISADIGTALIQDVEKLSSWLRQNRNGRSTSRESCAAIDLAELAGAGCNGERQNIVRSLVGHVEKSPGSIRGDGPRAGPGPEKIGRARDRVQRARLNGGVDGISRNGVVGVGSS